VSDWLVILVAAPLASFGEEPGNVWRGSADRPTRSALLGLAGAALGIDRADIDGQSALQGSFLMATRTLRPGLPLADFHTFQSLPETKTAPATRKLALARGSEVVTSVTRRDYRSDGLWQVAYAAQAHASVSLQTLRAAFLQPRFALWAGRKSCPLAHPLMPLIISSTDVDSAFLDHARQIDDRTGTQRLAAIGGTIAIDDRIPASDAGGPVRLHRRNDDPGDRRYWHFSRRVERIHLLRGTAAQNGEEPS
jgi:CRISPR system Cascade subunit CasD